MPPLLFSAALAYGSPALSPPSVKKSSVICVRSVSFELAVFVSFARSNRRRFRVASSLWRTVSYVSMLEIAEHSPISLSHPISVGLGVLATVACPATGMFCATLISMSGFFVTRSECETRCLCRFSYVSMSIHAFEKDQQTASGGGSHTHRIASPMSCEATVSWQGLKSYIFTLR